MLRTNNSLSTFLNVNKYHLYIQLYIIILFSNRQFYRLMKLENNTIRKQYGIIAYTYIVKAFLF